MQKIGIIGSGAVGQALAKGFLKYGYPTTIASRSKDKRNQLIEEIGQGINSAPPEETAKNADLVIFAVKGSQAVEALENISQDALSGKTVIDTTNPISDEGPKNGVLRYTTNINHSLMEELQEKYQDVRFVKAFSSVGSAHMVDPDFDQKPTMFICGNDAGAKQQVSRILDQFGWETEDMGTAEAARAIEPLAMLWCIPGFRENRWNHAFKLLKK
ncbi:MAG: NAD(P)-binding domain-containing protein [Saprospiraceae bacterium]|nr:NAD(P)-binding domain-containing protein [Saprospiraceae bacterium]